MENPINKDYEFSLVIPVYDEEDNILPFLVELVDKVKIPHKALIIYDYEKDSTLNKIKEAKSIHPNIIFVKNIYGKGVIKAFKTGFTIADTKYIVPIMADLSDMPETVNAMYRKIQEGYDLVVASRYVKGGAKIGGPLLKAILSRFANLSIHYLSGIPIHDLTNAFIMYRKEVLDQIQILSTGGFEITMEIIAKSFQQGFKITEVPTINRDRSAGKSKFQLFHWILKYLYWYMYIFLYSLKKRLRGFSRLEAKINSE
ncbi:glycosyltransferase [Deltaproteobacteria bacterium]|nr:glycosyltransferase [Deltaproteobacteria bacterium]